MKRTGTIVLLFAALPFIFGAKYIDDLAIDPRDVEDIIVPVEIEEVDVFAHTLYIPKGFDSNDRNVEIFVKGTMPNPCYQNPKAVISREGNKIKVEMFATLFKGKNRLCIAMTVPFLAPVSLGSLKEDNYEVKLLNQKEVALTSHLAIASPSSISVDNYIYAGVKAVESSNSGRIGILKGLNPSDCVELDEVKVISNGKNTLSVLPIMKQVSQNCPKVDVPFEYEFDIPNDLDSSRVLLHVRSMDGTSVNHEVRVR